MPNTSATCQEPLNLFRWFLVIGASAAVAVVSAKSNAGGWNDGSRLATVEALVDQRTFVIDNSIFVRVPPHLVASLRGPYPPGRVPNGTLDKLLIDGHFYSDKPQVPAVLMAGVYAMGRFLGLPRAAERPDLFCWLMTLVSSGLAYVVAVACLYRLGEIVGLRPWGRLLWTASFALSTVALPYARQVNGHIQFLGALAALLLNLVSLSRAPASASTPWARLIGLGTLAGLAYNTDMGSGLVLLPCLVPVVAFHCRRFAGFAIFLLSLLPWLAAAHGLNYYIGGVFKPLNAVPEYVSFPGAVFGPENMTGIWNHAGVWPFGIYGINLLFGERGIIMHNLPLFLALPALAYLLVRPAANWPEAAFCGCWCAGTWLLYSLLSNNFSGVCCSVRWFVPWLAPGYLLIAWFLLRFPSCWVDFTILSLGGAVLGLAMWIIGPWNEPSFSFQERIQSVTLIGWGAWRIGFFSFQFLRDSR